MHIQPTFYLQKKSIIESINYFNNLHVNTKESTDGLFCLATRNDMTYCPFIPDENVYFLILLSTNIPAHAQRPFEKRSINIRYLYLLSSNLRILNRK